MPVLTDLMTTNGFTRIISIYLLNDAANWSLQAGYVIGRTDIWFSYFFFSRNRDFSSLDTQYTKFYDTQGHWHANQEVTQYGSVTICWNI